MATILDCGHTPTTTDGPGTGYGQDSQGRTFCYACAADMDRATMMDGKPIGLYLTGRNVTNWPGSLTFNAHYVKESKGYGFGRSYPVRHAWFTGPDGNKWIIRVAGDMDCGTARRLRSAS